ncbi:MAG: FapA family protein [Fibromonadaceae bacterium]|jgi:uncharacterized protein (DUF342 family)|nr:FapA family protein [Fibromonadaceae bacterium]
MSAEINDDSADPEGSNWVNRFKITVSKDKMEVHLCPTTKDTSDTCKTFEEVISVCEKEGIKAELNEELIREQLLKVNPADICIARGVRPKRGEDGYIEYKVDMSAKPQFIAASKDCGAIDYKNAMQVTLVDKDDILAEIILPTEGKDGLDVRGNTLAAEPGAPANYFLGEGLEEKDGKVIVTAPGTPSIQDDVLMVRRNYILQGDVDLSTGNINFPGTVIIQGNVTDGFEVISEENIIVNGLIAGAKVKAKGHVKCSGGIQGKGQAEIVAGTFVAATFVNATTVYAEGDIIITKDSLHSNLNCLGEIRLGGSLIGGVATAFNGLECGNLGSDSGVKTLVNIRTHYRQEKAKEMANSVLEKVSAIFERYKLFVKQDYLNEEECAMLSQDITALQNLISKRQMFDGRAAKFDRMVFENKTAKVKILGTFEADAIVASPYTRYSCMAPVRGPLIVSENNSSAKMAILKGG